MGNGGNMPFEAKDEPGSRLIYDGMLAVGIKGFIFFGLLSVAITLWQLTAKNTTQREKYLLLGAWGILPPIWFLVEYFFIYLPYGVKGSFSFFQYGQDVASKLWAAIFGLISIALYTSREK